MGRSAVVDISSGVVQPIDDIRAHSDISPIHQRRRQLDRTAGVEQVSRLSLSGSIKHNEMAQSDEYLHSMEGKSQRSLSTTRTFKIAGASAQLPWYKSAESMLLSSSIVAHNIADDRSCQSRQEVTSKVCAHLLSQKFYLGNGLKFGGHMLVYPGTHCESLRRDCM